MAQKKKKTIYESDDLDLLNKSVTGRTPNQKEFLKAIDNNDIVFGIGDAGVGKTFLATSMAILGLYKGLYRKVIISRPIVDSGRSVGFLPGDIGSKLAPYVKPVIDELEHYIGYNQIKKLQNEDRIELLPFAYMRGRNFKNCFVICEEIQNQTSDGLKLILSRLCEGSKIVFTGDFKQSDIRDCDIEKYIPKLAQLDGIEAVYFDKTDIQRHPLVGQILEILEGKEYA